MADIIQAAKWLKAGKRIRRAILANSDDDSYFFGGRNMDNDPVQFMPGDNVAENPEPTDGTFWTEDLLATDWELVSRKRKSKG